MCVCIYTGLPYGSEKNLPTMRKTQVRFLAWEDPLEKEMANTPALLPGKSHRQRSLVGYSLRGHKESDTTEQLTLTHTHTVGDMCVCVCVCVCVYIYKI